ncbi:hypothetical protein ACU686_39575 [Yinghuangia aomiensis]
MNDNEERRSPGGREPAAPTAPSPDTQEDRAGRIRRLAAEIAAQDRELLDRLA